MKIKLLIVCFAIWGIANAQWQNTNSVSSQMNCVATSGTKVFAGRAGGGVEGSLDNGNTWTICCFNGMTNPHIWSLFIDGTNLFAATGSGVYLSTDNAVSWTPLNNGLPIFNSPQPNVVVKSIVKNGGNLFAGNAADGIYISNNYGASWSAVNNGLTNHSITVLAASGNNIFAGTNGGGIFLTTNDGANWMATNTGLTNGNITSIAIENDDIYIGTSGGGIFTSNNNGSTWTAVNNGLLNLNVTALAVSGENIFAGTSGGGVYVSSNGGSSWITQNDGLTNSNISGLSISGTNIFASIFMGGIWRRSISEMASLNDINIDDNIDIFPNPLSSSATLKSDIHLFNATLTIENCFGQVVTQINNVNGQTINLHRDNLPCGLYFVRLKEKEKEIAIKKIIISN